MARRSAAAQQRRRLGQDRALALGTFAERPVATGAVAERKCAILAEAAALLRRR